MSSCHCLLIPEAALDWDVCACMHTRGVCVTFSIPMPIAELVSSCSSVRYTCKFSLSLSAKPGTFSLFIPY